MSSKNTIMRRTGGWNVVMGITAITLGLAVGVGCLVTGGALLSASKR